MVRIVKKIAKLACLTAIGFGIVYGCAYSPDTEIIEYRKEVDKGDTVWSICANIATDQDNLSELVHRTCVENHLHDGEIHEGMELIIHVERRPSFSEEIESVFHQTK